MHNKHQSFNLKKLLNIEYLDYNNLNLISKKVINNDFNLKSCNDVMEFDMYYSYYENSDKYLSELVDYSLQCDSETPFILLTCKLSCISDCILITYINDTTNPTIIAFNKKTGIENIHINEFIHLKKDFNVTQANKFLDFIKLSETIQSRITMNDCLYFYTTTDQMIDSFCNYQTKDNETQQIMKSDLNPRIVLLTKESMISFYGIVWNIYNTFQSLYFNNIINRNEMK